MGAPRNDWYHCMCGTYGTWLRGDARGWRERWHRRHVEGDYRKPPAKGTFEKVYEQSVRAMKRGEVRLSKELRRVALAAVVEKLLEKGIQVVVACLDDHHLHLLAPFPGSSSEALGGDGEEERCVRGAWGGRKVGGWNLVEEVEVRTGAGSRASGERGTLRCVARAARGGRLGESGAARE